MSLCNAKNIASRLKLEFKILNTDYQFYKHKNIQDI